MAVQFKNKNGKTVTLLNPAEKGEKFAKELRRGVKHTNSGSIKTDKNKKGIRLTAEQRAYRSGYLDARTDSAKAFKAKKKGR